MVNRFLSTLEVYILRIESSYEKMYNIIVLFYFGRERLFLKGSLTNKSFLPFSCLKQSNNLLLCLFATSNIHERNIQVELTFSHLKMSSRLSRRLLPLESEKLRHTIKCERYEESAFFQILVKNHN